MSNGLGLLRCLLRSRLDGLLSSTGVKWSTQFYIWYVPDASGGTCPVIFRTTLRSIPATADGASMERLTDFTIACAARFALRPIEKQNRALR